MSYRDPPFSAIGAASAEFEVWSVPPSTLDAAVDSDGSSLGVSVGAIIKELAAKIEAIGELHRKPV